MESPKFIAYLLVNNAKICYTLEAKMQKIAWR